MSVEPLRYAPGMLHEGSHAPGMGDSIPFCSLRECFARGSQPKTPRQGSLIYERGEARTLNQRLKRPLLYH